MTRIIVGVDGSEVSTSALAWALDEARLLGEATVVLAHGYRAPEARNPYAYGYPYLPLATAHQLTAQERERLEQQEETVRSRAQSLLEQTLRAVGGAPSGVEVEYEIVAHDPAGILVELSAKADLVVVGSRGLGGFKGLLLGSVSQQCLHHARCPVVVVRDQG